jgi:hypothetical protein
MRHRQLRNRRNISQEVSNSMRLMSAGFLRLGYLAPDIGEAIAKSRQPRCMTVKRLLQGVPCVWAEQRIAFGFAH